MQVGDPIESYQSQQALLQEVQDRFGCLFMDFKGTSKVYFLAALLRLLVPALKGSLLGWFVSECGSLPLVLVAGKVPLRPCGLSTHKPFLSASCQPGCFAIAGVLATTAPARALVALGALMALQGCSLMVTLLLRPHISRVVTLCEVMCSCLEIAITAALIGAYMTPAGDVAKLAVSKLAVACVRRACSGDGYRAGWDLQRTVCKCGAACEQTRALAVPAESRLPLRCAGMCQHCHPAGGCAVAPAGSAAGSRRPGVCAVQTPVDGQPAPAAGFRCGLDGQGPATGWSHRELR